jgi:hypothetical protein
MLTGNQMIDSTLPDFFEGRTEEEPESDEYEPEEELIDNN